MNTVKKKTQFRSQFSLVNILSSEKNMEILILNNVLSGKMYKQILMLKRDRILCVNLLSEFCVY